jgi:sec-independent protein translocase protein TatA
MTTTLAMFGIEGPYWIIILVIGLLLFGRRLPEIGRNVGKSIVEFKRGLKDAGNEAEKEASRSSTQHLPGSQPSQSAPSQSTEQHRA